jgi:hypothetical protein
MQRRIIKSTLLATIVSAVLCAGTVSARQLRTDAKGFAACHGTCTSSTQCSTGCVCAFALEATTGTCLSHPTGAQPPAR